MKIVLLFFFFNLSVNASEPHSQSYVDEPIDCFAKQQFPCAVRFIKKAQRLQIGDGNYYGQKGTSLVFLEPQRLRLLEGVLFAVSDLGVTISGGVAEFQSKGESLIEKSHSSKVEAMNFSGELKVKGVFHNLSEEIPVGLSKWYSGTNLNGSFEQGILGPIEPSRGLSLWRDLTFFSKQKAKNKIDAYKKTWKEGLEISSALYKEVVQRRIASSERRRLQKQKQIEFEQQERKKLIQLFRERNYLNNP